MYAVKRGPRRGVQTGRIDVILRTPHIHYLEFLAEQHGLSISGALGRILDKHADLALSTTKKPPRKEPKHLLLEPRHAEILDKLSVRYGLFKADIARRLIDAAMEQDDMVGDDDAYLARRIGR